MKVSSSPPQILLHPQALLIHNVGRKSAAPSGNEVKAKRLPAMQAAFFGHIAQLTLNAPHQQKPPGRRTLVEGACSFSTLHGPLPDVMLLAQP